MKKFIAHYALSSAQLTELKKVLDENGQPQLPESSKLSEDTCRNMLASAVRIEAYMRITREFDEK